MKVCPEVFELTHGNSSSTDNWYPVWVNFTCWPGYWFPDGDTSRMSQCNQHGKWSEIIPQCTSEYNTYAFMWLITIYCTATSPKKFAIMDQYQSTVIDHGCPDAMRMSRSSDHHDVLLWLFAGFSFERLISIC